MKRTVQILCFGALILVCILAVLTVAVSGGLGPSAESDGKTMLVATAPYSYDFDSVDREVLHDRLAEVIDVPFEVGIARNYVHGYPEILITSLEPISASEDAVIKVLNDNYPEMDIKAVDRFDLSVKKSSATYFITAGLLALVFFIVIAVFFAFTGHSVIDALKWLVIALLSVTASLFFENLIGCSNGDKVVMFTFFSIITSAAAVIYTVNRADQKNTEQKFIRSAGFKAFVVAVLVLCGAAASGMLLSVPGWLNTMLIVAATVIPTIAASAVSIPVLFKRN